MTHFESRPVSVDSYPFTRGAWTLSQFVTSTQPALKPCDIIHTPGHWAVLFNQRRALCIFDACPHTFLLDRARERDNLSSFANLKELNDDPEKAGEQPIFTFATARPNRHFVKIFFTSSSPLRLFAMTNSGALFCWQWFVGTERPLYKWKPVQGGVYLTEGLTVNVHDIVFSPATGHFVWWETDSDSKQQDIAKELHRRRSLGNAKRAKWKRLGCRQIEFAPREGGPRGDVVTVTMKVRDPSCAEGGIVDGLDEEIQELVATKRGVWIRLPQSVGFWPYTGSSHFVYFSYDLPEDATAEEKQNGPQSKILFMIKHQNTDDVLLIEESGRVLLLSHSTLRSEISCRYLCTLAVPESLGGLTAVRYMVAQQHYFILLFSDDFCACDLRSGALLDRNDLPYDIDFSVIPQRESAMVGLDSLSTKTGGGVIQGPHFLAYWQPSDGLHEIIPATAVHQIEQMGEIPHADHSHLINYQANISRAWKMDRRDAKHTLCELIAFTRGKKAEGVEHERLIAIQQSLARELLPHLENPSLLMLLLRDKAHKSFLQNILSKFLQDYIGEDELPPDANAVDVRNKMRRSYFLHTPFNSTLISLLNQFHQLSSQQTAVSIPTASKGVEATANNQFEMIWVQSRLESGQSLLNATRATFEMIISQHPARSLVLLEEFLELDAIWRDMGYNGSQPDRTHFLFPRLLPVHHTLLQQGEESISEMQNGGTRAREHPLFRNLCRLYFRTKPAFLIPFVLLVHESYKSTLHHQKPIARTFLDRAVDLLPPLLTVSPENGELAEVQIKAMTTLLCLAGHGQRAIEYLLAHDRWTHIMTLMRKYKEEKDHLPPTFTSQSQLFHSLLMWCIEHNDQTHLQQLWDFVPPKFGVLNLLRVIESYQTKRKENDSVLVDPNYRLTVGCFRAQMIAMFQRSQMASEYFD